MRLRLDFLKYFRNYVKEIIISEQIKICRDEKDNKFLELAVNGNADFIITGDKDLLVLNPFRTIRIISPSLFIQDMSSK
jgi:putative PIN family toxin of toxin-antitoxin system